MGCAGSKETDTSDQDARSKQLEAELAEQQKKEDEITKLLVLGTGESGKSTVFKQMKILYQKPDPTANTKFIMVCRANLFGNAHAVAKGMDVLGIKFSTDEGRDAAKKITELPAGGDAEITAELPAAFAAMYSDAGVNEAIERASEFQLNDSTRYFFQRADEVREAAASTSTPPRLTFTTHAPLTPTTHHPQLTTHNPPPTTHRP